MILEWWQYILIGMFYGLALTAGAIAGWFMYDWEPE